MFFDQMVEKYNIPRRDFFRFFQIRHYIVQSTTLISNTDISPLEKMLFGTVGKMSISLLYRAMHNVPPVTLQEFREKWEKEFSITINEWEGVWIYVGPFSVCNCAKSIQFKILHRMHISPNRRHNFNPTLSPMCLKCKTEIGTLTHCLWSCHKLQRY